MYVFEYIFKKKMFKLYDRKYKLQNFPLKSTEAENAEKFT